MSAPRLKLRLRPDAAPIELRQDGPPCSVCLSLDCSNDFPPEEGRMEKVDDFTQGTISLRDLRKSAAGRCGYCTIILRSGCLVDAFDTYEAVELSFGHEEGPELRWLSASNQHTQHVWLHGGQVSSFGPFPKTYSVSPPNMARTNSAFAKQMLDRCEKEHDRCIDNEAVMPTRLLFIGEGQEAMRIVDRSEMARTGHYAALSHCWGQSRTLKLQRDNEVFMKTAVAWNSLPTTYKDAVTVCQSLKIDYLWIDSICILQDDVEDWEREASKMADVYEKAFLTIAANSCADTNDSFLTPSRRCLHVIAWTGGERAEPLLVAGPPLSRGHHRTKPSLWASARSFSIDPLETRAWAFQESVLPRRLLRFTSEEIQWSCAEAHGCECGSRAQSLTAQKDNTYTTKDWLSLVETYSERQLTYSSDRLPAMSGLATRYYKRHGDNYVAGLWMNDDMASQLAWCMGTEHKSERSQREDISLIPTFSWAAVDGGVFFPMKLWSMKDFCVNFVSILDAQSTLRGQNRFGQVVDGFVRLRGRLIPGTVLCGGDFPCVGLTEAQELRVKMIPDAFVDEKYLVPTVSQNKEQRRRSFRWTTFVNEARIPVWCLRLLGDFLLGDVYLVLVDSLRGPHVYERVGSVHLDQIDAEATKQSLPSLWNVATEKELILV
ncbi:hypothetical protein D0Z07_6776 [Hyphodiscus hymeniophilus]|uniref:Heterokaryon incompatibility domain-containing protein n=1 Tax=Hyphodiscus hymeniophilus TaxID=353542 RepID=A0A9P6VGU0_9HELO|nr:hypothetical protein D0Z07_6776 [Hyphodiscus hymeniophilus]